MSAINTGRNLVLCSIVTSPDCKRQVSNAAFANQIKFYLDQAGVLLQGQPGRIPSPLIVNTVESQFHLGYTRSETSVSMYVNLSAPIDSLTISDAVSHAWNNCLITNGSSPQLPSGANSLSGSSDLSATSTFNGQYALPPGSVFEDGSREACERFYHPNLGIFNELLPTEEDVYQVRTVYCPVPESGDIPMVGVGAVDSLTTSAIRDSNVPSMIGQSDHIANLPSAQDIITAARTAGTAASNAFHQAWNEAVGGALGVDGSDIKTLAYISLAIVGALVAVKVLKEIRKI